MSNSFKHRGFNLSINKKNNQYSSSLIYEKYGNKIHRNTKNELINSLVEQIDHFYKDYPMLESKQDKEPKAYILLIIIAVVIAMLLALFSYYPAQNIDKAMSIGDIKISNVDWLDNFGSFFNNFSAPIVSFFSFTALLWTIHQQNKSQSMTKEELRLTRIELEYTRVELKNSGIAQREQADTLEEQLELSKKTAQEERFDSTFYALLEKHNDVLLELEKDNSLSAYKRISVSFDEIHNSPNHCRYFRILYQLLKFIALGHNQEEILNTKLFSCEVTEKEKFYSSLVRSMLTDKILYMLAINCHKVGVNKNPYVSYKSLIVRYNFLEHLKFNFNIDKYIGGYISHHQLMDDKINIVKFYDMKAFGDNLYFKKITTSIENYQGTLICHSNNNEENKRNIIRYIDSKKSDIGTIAPFINYFLYDVNSNEDNNYIHYWLGICKKNK